MAACDLCRKFGEVRPCGFSDMRTDRRTEILVAVFHTPLRGEVTTDDDKSSELLARPGVAQREPNYFRGRIGFTTCMEVSNSEGGFIQFYIQLAVCSVVPVTLISKANLIRLGVQTQYINVIHTERHKKTADSVILCIQPLYTSIQCF